ncbi:hypothetical protein NLG97_g6937 [Lecanicillium saksenae]|uniref:Uncharacterized protein n=1 Tax=Lecanicillium saksenae TaxID=468837 RepID=A0ACC1QN86_9HYPO|nr:hypothetical protein NLG97_g6937 [Lecanicillium saksenae]
MAAPSTTTAAVAVQKVKVAFEEQMRDGPVLLDQQYFLDKYWAILEEIPEAQRNYARSCIREEIFRRGNDQKQVGLREWIRTFDLEDTFFLNEDTQRQRYRDIEESLSKTELERDSWEQNFNAMAVLFQDRSLQRDADKFFAKHAKDMKSVVGLQTEIDQKRAERRYDAMRLRRLEISSRPDHDRISNKPILNINIGSLEEEANLRVYTGLYGTSFYCGHPGGTYIFRYEDPAWQKATEAVNHNVWEAFPHTQPTIPWIDDYSQLLDKEASHTRKKARENFTYCGHVPRPKSEYLMRLKKIHGRVIHMIAATLTYYNWRNVTDEPDMVGPLGDRVCSITRLELGILLAHWDIQFASGFDVPDDVRNVFRESPVVAEFVHLVNKLAPTEDGPDTKGVRALVDLLTLTTRWTTDQLVQLEEKWQGHVARCLLLDNHQVMACFGFVGPDTNIHEHFGPSTFELDPNHPNARYLITHDFGERVKEGYKLVHELELKWKVFERERRQTRAQNHSQGTGTAGKSLPGNIAGSKQAASPIDESQASSSTPSQTTQTSTEPPVKRGRGRPKGSRNRPKI